MNFLLRTPFLRLLLLLIAGMLSIRILKLPDLLLLLPAIPAFLAVFISFLLPKSDYYRLRWLFGAGVLVLVFLLGHYLAAHQHRQQEIPFPEEAMVYRLELRAPPVEKEKTVSCVVSILPSDRLSTPVPKLLVYIQKDSASRHLQQGDQLLAFLHPQPPVALNNPEGFDYATYLQRKGIGATAYVDAGRWTKTGASTTRTLRQRAEVIRMYLIDVFRKLSLSREDFGVLAALVLGYKEALEPELLQHYAASGAMHILAVSGLHVGVVYLLINSLLSLVVRRNSLRILKAVLVLSALWMYAFITGLPPSVMRAGLMISVVVVANAIHRRSLLYNTISATAFFLLLLNPAYIYDLGFQLSYAAVFGIVYFQARIASVLTVQSRPLKWMWELTAVSLAAQLGTLPLSLLYFNQFPNYFLLTNYLAIPLASCIIYVAVAYLVVAAVPIAGAVVGWVLARLLTGLNALTEFIHSLPGALTEVYISSPEFVLLVTGMFCWIAYAGLKKYSFLVMGLVAVLLLVSFRMITAYESAQQERMIVYADYAATHLQLTAGVNEWVLTTDSAAFVKVARKFRLKHRLKNQQFSVRTQSYYFNFNGRRVAVVADHHFRRKHTTTPLKVDYLIVQAFSRQKVSQLMGCFLPETCIVGASVSDFYTLQLQKWCSEHQIAFHSISMSGAFQEQKIRSNKNHRYW
ncbi:MAG: ComEC/Rec2 family competence protein [Paludibacter sp.]|nr:ComEC/Rec2 family competence protein [Paludibacter sp.]